MDGVVLVEEVHHRPHVELAPLLQHPLLQEPFHPAGRDSEQLGGEGVFDVVDQDDLVLIFSDLSRSS